jgi:hypothetical protein
MKSKHAITGTTAQYEPARLIRINNTIFIRAFVFKQEYYFNLFILNI